MLAFHRCLNEIMQIIWALFAKIRQETTNSIFEEVEFMLGLTDRLVNFGQIQLLNSTFQINLPESTR